MPAKQQQVHYKFFTFSSTGHDVHVTPPGCFSSEFVLVDTFTPLQICMKLFLSLDTLTSQAGHLLPPLPKSLRGPAGTTVSRKERSDMKKDVSL